MQLTVNAMKQLSHYLLLCVFVTIGTATTPVFCLCNKLDNG